jgi:hypothetical protein
MTKAQEVSRMSNEKLYSLLYDKVGEDELLRNVCVEIYFRLARKTSIVKSLSRTLRKIKRALKDNLGR